MASRYLEQGMIDTSVPVVDLCRGGYGDVSIARTLGRLGVPMYLVTQQGLATPVWSSRYWSDRTRWDFAVPEEESIRFLLGLGATLRAAHRARPILLTTSDWLAIFIERNCDRLQDEFLFPYPIRPVIRKLADKWQAYLLAKQHRIPTPATARPASHVDVEEFLESHGLPVVIKAADPYVTPAPAKKIVYSRDELMTEINHPTIGTPLNLILQEYIPGAADTVWMCNAYIGPVTHHTVFFTGKKLRQISPTGIACLAICLPNDTVATQTHQFMTGVGYRGCVGIGFRYDSRDDMYKLLDVNPRVSAIFRLFAGTNEMDVVRACYLDLTGQPVPKTRLMPGRRWMREDDVVRALSSIRNGRMSFKQWRDSVRGVQELHWFARDDPVPILSWAGQQIRARAL